MVIAAQSGTPLHVSYTNHLPGSYPDWIPVDPRLTHGNGRKVRPMTHLHGGFVAADSDGNPMTDDGAGYFTTIRAKFDLPKGVTGPQSYVHHCHIVEHEDNEMMRPLTVIP
jgi:FtsP/CotA-like multicopper oxidase with cupredoxin domain